MPGLDPGIQRLAPAPLLDCRVRPGNDEVGETGENPLRRMVRERTKTSAPKPGKDES